MAAPKRTPGVLDAGRDDWGADFRRATLMTTIGVAGLFALLSALARLADARSMLGLADWEALAAAVALLALPVAFAGAIVVIKIAAMAYR